MIEVLPDDKERQFVEQMIQTALSAGMIDFEDAFRVRSIKNVKLAEMYLAKAKKNKEKSEMEKARVNSEMNAQSQQQSLQMKAQMDAQLAEIETQSKVTIVSTELEMKKYIQQQAFIHSALLKSFELGRPLTPELQMLVSEFFNEKQQEAMQKQAMQEQQMMQQQMQQGEGEQQQYAQEEGVEKQEMDNEA
jgi:hypothetical protein